MKAVCICYLVVVLSFTSFFGVSNSALTVTADKGPTVVASEGKSAEFKWKITDGKGFDKIDFGPATVSGDVLPIAIRLTKGSSLPQFHPDYKNRIVWNVKTDVDPVIAVFILSNVSKSDARKYGIKVTKDGINKGESVDLIVSELNIVEQPVSVFTTEGAEANFSVNATGPPTPNITWYKGREKVKPSSLVKIEDDGKGYSRLTIKKCTAKDVGEYRAEVTNPPDLTKYSEKAYLAIPFVHLDKSKSTGTTKEKLGSTVTLACAFTGFPPPVINWTYPSGTWESTGSILTVQLRKADDFGNYTCSSLDGNLTHTISVNRIGKVNVSKDNGNQKLFYFNWAKQKVDGVGYVVFAKSAHGGSNAELELIGCGGKNRTDILINSKTDFPKDYFQTSKSVKTEFSVIAIEKLLSCVEIRKETADMIET